jgi:ribonuclease T
VRAAGLEWHQAFAHSALYDAERTAQLFFWMINRWSDLTALEKASTDRDRDSASR